MSRLALIRLVCLGNRSATFRLAGIAAGVMIGVALFLLLFGASQAFGERSLRSSWTELTVEDPVYLSSPDTKLATDEVAAAVLSDYFAGDTVRVLMVAAPADSTVRIPGVDQIPQPGQYVASPALEKLINSVPANELGNRYGKQRGTIAASALEGPDSLVVVVGASVPEVVAADPFNAQIVTQFIGYDYGSYVYRTVAIIGAIAVLVPVLLLIAIVTDLGASQRAERFATLRLIGATPQRVARIAGVETAVATLVGAIVGVGLYVVTIPLAARLEIGTSRFYPDDLLTSPVAMGAVVAITVAGAAGVAWWRTRRADIGPLGATRERQERRLRVWSLLPLVFGIAVLAAAVLIDSAVPVKSVSVVAGFAFVMLGLLLAGPLLTSWVAKVGALRARSAAQVIGYHRVIRHPRAGFRTVAGFVVAVYTVSVFAVAITGATSTGKMETGTGYLPTSTLFAATESADSSKLEAAVTDIQSTPGVTAVVQAWSQDDGALIMTKQAAQTLGVPEVDSKTGYVSISSKWLVNSPADPKPAAATSVGETGSGVLFVATDGTTSAIERARTAISTSDMPVIDPPMTRQDGYTLTALAMENQFATLAYIGILIAVALSALSLTVSTVAALISRQRVFGLLKLTGMQTKTLRSIVSYETVTPVATVFLLSIALGVYTAWAVIAGLAERTIDWPDPSYYIIIAVCIFLVVLAITATTVSASRMLRGNTIRFE